MFNPVRLAIRAEIARIRLNIGASVRKIESRAGAAIRNKLANYPSVRPLLGRIGYTIGKIAAADPYLFGHYFGIADFLAERGKAVFPDYRTYESRKKIIRDNLSLAASLSQAQVAGLLGSLGPNDRAFAIAIKHTYIMEQVYNNVINTGEIDPRTTNPFDQDPPSDPFHYQFTRDIKAFTARTDKEISPQPKIVIDGTVIELDQSDHSRPILKSRKALPKPV